MQTSINKLMALGIPGEHANTQPYFADAYIAATDVTMGGAAGIKDGKVGAMGTNFPTFYGIFVSPHEHVKMELPSDSMSLKVAKGATVAVAKKGSWFLAVPTAEVSKWTVDAKVYVKADGTITADAQTTPSGGSAVSNTEIGVILATDGIVAAVRLG